jgi:hypothetical protein
MKLDKPIIRETTMGDIIITNHPESLSLKEIIKQENELRKAMTSPKLAKIVRNAKKNFK